MIMGHITESKDKKFWEKRDNGYQEVVLPHNVYKIFRKIIYIFNLFSIIK